jgi:Carbohydrate binding module (family 6)/Galactose oxidase, central domain
MVDFHSVPTATLLPNGEVLIVGGDVGDGDGPSSSAELYNPETGTFARTGNLTTGREDHSATLLPDGTVLMAGGHGAVPVSGGGFDNLSVTELYNPASGTFRPSGNMATGRDRHQATLLDNGTVLITGGAEYYPFGAGTRPYVYGLLASAELYTPGSTASTPHNGAAASIPGTIQAENYDDGGEGIAYHDISPGNSGGQYRSDGVDIEVTSDTGGGYDVGWVDAGEWLNYTVTVAQTGPYTVTARVAANGSGGTFHVEVDGVNQTGALTIPNTGGWQAWTTLTKTGVSLTAGSHVVKLVIDASGSSGIVGNINWLNFASSAPH